MSDGKKTKMIPAPRAIVYALIAGAVAGALAVYVRGGPSGNNAPAEIAAAPAPAPAADDACPAKADKAKALAATAVGGVAAMTPADPPQSLAALSFNGPDGKPMTIADHAGKTLLVNLWATWCAPCLKEMPALDALQGSLGGPDFAVVAVNIDTRNLDKPKAWLAENRIEKLGYYADPQAKVFQQLRAARKVEGMPVSLLVDREGCELAILQGPADWASADAKALVGAALRP